MKPGTIKLKNAKQDLEAELNRKTIMCEFMGLIKERFMKNFPIVDRILYDVNKDVVWTKVRA